MITASCCGFAKHALARREHGARSCPCVHMLDNLCTCLAQVQAKVYASGKAPGLAALAQGTPAAGTSSGGQPDRTCALELNLHFPQVSPYTLCSVPLSGRNQSPCPGRPCYGLVTGSRLVLLRCLFCTASSAFLALVSGVADCG